VVGVIELLRSNDPVLMSFVASLLLDAGIKHSITDAHMSVIEGSIGALPSRILVADEQHGDACCLLADAGIPIHRPSR
jgi:Putative prokaryotic signal transducing protein